MLRRQSFHCSGCVTREEFAAKMPTRCVAGGCSNTPDLEKGIALSLPSFGDDRPQAKKRQKRWVDFVKQKRAKWEPSKNSAIYSRVVQYSDIMRFMILCDRHHKVSPNPNR